MPHNHGDAMDSLTAVTEKWKSPHGMAGIDATGKAGAGGEFAEEVTKWDAPTAHDGRRPGVDHASTNGTNLNRQSVAFHPDPDSDLTALLEKFSTLSPKESRTQAIAFLQNLLNGRRGSESSKPGPTSRRRLNPKFVEWLIGLPENWASVEPISFEDLETASCQTVLRKR